MLQRIAEHICYYLIRFKFTPIEKMEACIKKVKTVLSLSLIVAIILTVALLMFYSAK